MGGGFWGDVLGGFFVVFWFWFLRNVNFWVCSGIDFGLEGEWLLLLLLELLRFIWVGIGGINWLFLILCIKVWDRLFVVLISIGLEILRVIRFLRIVILFLEELEFCFVTEGLELEELEFCFIVGFNVVVGEEGLRVILGVEGFSVVDGVEGFSVVDDEVGLSVVVDVFGFRVVEGVDGLRVVVGVEGFNVDFGSLLIGCVFGLIMGLGVEVNEGGLIGFVGLFFLFLDSFFENLEKSDLDFFVLDGIGLSFIFWNEDFCCLVWLGGILIVIFW